MRSKVINPSFISLNGIWCIINWEQYGCRYGACLFLFLFFLLAVESELVACSAVIKRRWRYRAASQRLSVLAGVTRLTPSLTSLPKAARNPDSYIETCGPPWFWCGEMLNTDFRFQLFILLHRSGVDFHLIWDILKSSWVKGFLTEAILGEKKKEFNW